MDGQKDVPKAPIEMLLDGIQWHPVENYQSDNDDDTPYVTHEGVLDLGEQFPKMRCYQLDTGQRVFDADDVNNFFAGGTGLFSQ